MTAALLRLALRALVALQPRLPEPAQTAVARAVALAPTVPEAADERAIDALRAHLAATDATVEVVDYGAGTSGSNGPVRRVSEVYRRASSGPLWGRVMTGLVRELRPIRVLELGTSLGMSAAHIASALRQTAGELDADALPVPPGRLVTLEGAPALAALARRHLAALGHDDESVRVVVGPFAATLPAVCASDGPFDLVFIDGHHERQAALDYVAAVRPHLTTGAVVVLDDVEPGRPVRAAFRALAREASAAVWLGKWGVLVFGAPPDMPAEGGAPHGLARPTDAPAVPS